ncbi:MAG: DUF6036 family nucleotidyltransferase [Actinomycetota bacterium]
MNREEFEHVVRAAANIVDDEIVVAGSQAVLGQFPDAPSSLLRSHEVDVFPKNAPERALEIDASIGDGSRFHDSFEYYAHGIGPETLIAPAGWENRLIRVELPALAKKGGQAIAWCLEIHDLLLSKLAAGRPHDLTFARDALEADLADLEQLRMGIDLLPPSHQESTRARLEGLEKQLLGG